MNFYYYFDVAGHPEKGQYKTQYATKSVQDVLEMICA